MLIAPCLSRLAYRALLIALINCLLLAGMLACASACLADVIPWDANAQGQFITSLCRDLQGNTWIGTEDQGVWRFDPSAPKDKQYTHFTQKDGLGDDNAYALACDKAGRIWLGSLNHGVSVFNGKQWKTYGPLDGPLGSRVFALAVSPKDGGVWGATEAGLFRYDQSRWTYFTRESGLPSDQANALAFGSDGTLYVGTQCDGIAIASPDDNYKTWRIVPGPSTALNAPVGTGLPSALINCLLVSSDNVVYAGTDGGLAWSRDEGESWTFTRGNDWKAKIAGLLHPVTLAPVPAALVSTNFLLEDYVTCLAEDASGRLWIGHRQQGVEVFDPKTIRWVQSGANGIKANDDVNCLLTEGTNVWVGLYGGGLHPPDASPVEANSSASASVAPLPVPAKPPTLTELNTLLRVVSAVAPDKDELGPKVVALDDDWVTEGDWLGRYGRYWTCLCATSSPSDYNWGAGWEPVRYALQLGPNHTGDDKLRYWIEWLYTQNPHVLELPSVYMDTRVQRKLTTWDSNRREAEIDDHGETYPMTMDGPNIYCSLNVPNGLFYLSLYDFNKDGHTDNNRFRDYRISIRPSSPGKDFGDISDFAQQPEWAHSRLRSFWDGAYKRFLVRGPVQLTIEVSRNYSFNTILPAVMLDLVDENPPPYTGTPEARLAWRNTQRKLLLTQWQSKNTQRLLPAHTEAQAAEELLNALQGLQFTNGTWRAINGHRFYSPLLRWYAAQVKRSAAPNKSLLSSLATCYYQMGIYDAWEQCQRQAGLTPARDIEKALRFDGNNGFGHGFEAVSDYAANRSTTQKGEKPQPIPDFQPGSIEAGGH